MKFHPIEPLREYVVLKHYSSRIVCVPVCSKIDHCAFLDQEEPEWISIPETVRHIGDWAFSGCGNLKTVLLNAGLETIGENAFAQTHLQEIHLPDTLVYLGDGCFEDTMLETVTVPGGIRHIGADTFRGNLFLHTVCLKEGVEQIGNGAFSRCRHLREIYIPDTLERIAPYAFEDSTPIATIHASRRWRQEHPRYIHLLKKEG